MSGFGSIGGCDFAVDPLTPPPDAPVFWQPQEDTSVIVLCEAPRSLASIAHDPLPTWRPDPPADDGTTFRLNIADGQYLQIMDDAAETGTAAVAVVPLGIEGFDQIEAILRFLSALHGRAIPPDTRLTDQQRARQRRMLRAFDGYRAGATQQEIAQVLFNSGHLDRDEWQASSLRHTVKALLRDARAMIAGGYRKLLRHRR